jgi:hypothetical protein
VELICDICEKPFTRKVLEDEGHNQSNCLINQLKDSKNRISELENQNENLLKEVQAGKTDLISQTIEVRLEKRKLMTEFWRLKKKSKN